MQKITLLKINLLSIIFGFIVMYKFIGKNRKKMSVFVLKIMLQSKNISVILYKVIFYEKRSRFLYVVFVCVFDFDGAYR